MEALPRPARPHGQGPADDRLDRRRGHGAGAHLLPGQVDPQLDQPRGRPRPLRAGRAAGAALRRGAGRRPDRREGDGGHRSSARSRSPAAATRSSTEEMGVQPEDIWWDALVFPCGTGDAAYLGLGGADDRRGARRSRSSLPDAKTVLGVSNVSFGLPDAGREVLNSVFLYHATRRGSTRPSSTPRSSRATPTSRTRSARWPRR